MNYGDQEFLDALRIRAPRYELELAPAVSERLRDYYAHIAEWNARLHLVAPCPPAEFATRHVLESLIALPYFSTGAHVADIGSGAGLPIIPCLIARPDLRATLIEASPKKAVFLREALRRLELHTAAQVVAARFEETTPPPSANYVTCRALEKFIETLPRLVRWSPPSSTLLLFGGPTLDDKIASLRLTCSAIQMPDSEQRFLFIVGRETN